MWFVFRLLLIIVAISVFQRLVRTVLRLLAASSHSHRTVSQTPPVSHATANEGTTVLQQDPVCGTYVSVDSSLKRIVQGHVLHFCSPECRDRYSVSA